MVAHFKYHPNHENPESVDERMWVNFRNGDATAFERIFKKYNPILTHYGIKFFYDRDVVEDCIQELFLQLWNKRDTLPEVNTVKYYLIASLRRLLLRKVVLLKRESDFNNSVATEQRAEVSSHESQLIHQLSIKENSDKLALAIEQLPPRQRQAVYLKFYEERSYEEITSMMSINYQTARKFIYKGLQVIREKLAHDPSFLK